MVMAAIAIFGIIAFFRLNINEYPDIDYPYVTVTTRLKGASPEIMELDITDPLEEEINTI